MIWFFTAPICIALWGGMVFGLYCLWHFRPGNDPNKKLSVEQIEALTVLAKAEAIRDQAKYKLKREY